MDLQRFRSSIVATKAFAAVADIIPESGAPAIYATDPTKKPLSFNGLRDFVASVDLRRFGLTRESVVCTAIPNGPEACLCFWAFMSQCVFAPLNPNLTVPEIEFELHDLPAAAMIVMEGDAKAKTVEECCKANGVQVIYLTASKTTAGLFTLSGGKDGPAAPATTTKAADLGLVLHTSGTTKKPKIVPLTHHNIGHGIQFVAKTLCRQKDHICLNVMPLFHIHGLIANVGASIFSQAPLICSVFMGGVDFLDSLSPKSGAHPTPTWYSAVPTMHEAILLDAEAAGEKLKHSLTMMRNCSAALLPPVSKRFLKAFGAASPSFTVVPTYAMTESFPICSNPPSLEVKLSTVGPSMGPTVKILQGHPDDTEVAAGEEGEVCVSGECVTSGYLMREHMATDPNIEAFSLPTSSVGRMLRTGDKGYLDADGYLQLVGRFKEIINCGGEKVSPLELEDQLLHVEGVETCVCFAVDADLYGEVVGVACVTKAGQTPPTIQSLRDGIKESGARFKPEVLVHMEAIPKGPTGKPKRIGLAKMLGIPTHVATVGPATFTISGKGDNLGTLMRHTRIFTNEYQQGPCWFFPMTISLIMNPDLDHNQQSTHVLVIEDATCNECKLTVTTYQEDGTPVALELPISAEDARSAVNYIDIRTADNGLDFLAKTATDPDRGGENFACDFHAEDGTKKLSHVWRVDCKDTPPGRALRLLRILDFHHEPAGPMAKMKEFQVKYGKVQPVSTGPPMAVSTQPAVEVA